MIPLELMAGALILAFAFLLLLAVSNHLLRRDLRDVWAYLDTQGPVQLEKAAQSRLIELETQVDKLQDAYNRLRGTVARLHRSDVRPPEEPAAAPASLEEMDPSQKAAYKEKLRESARAKGHRL